MPSGFFSANAAPRMPRQSIGQGKDCSLRSLTCFHQAFTTGAVGSIVLISNGKLSDYSNSPYPATFFSATDIL